MPDSSQSGTTSTTLIFEGGEPVYQCRCGETHRGTYAAEEWNHHNCFHDALLWPVDAEDGHFICSQCGKDFWVEGPENA